MSDVVVPAPRDERPRPMSIDEIEAAIEAGKPVELLPNGEAVIRDPTFKRPTIDELEAMLEREREEDRATSRDERPRAEHRANARLERITSRHRAGFSMMRDDEAWLLGELASVQRALTESRELAEWRREQIAKYALLYSDMQSVLDERTSRLTGLSEAALSVIAESGPDLPPSLGAIERLRTASGAALTARAEIEEFNP